MENHFENRGEEDSWWQEAEIIGVTDRTDAALEQALPGASALYSF